MFCSGFALGDW